MLSSAASSSLSIPRRGSAPGLPRASSPVSLADCFAPAGRPRFAPRAAAAPRSLLRLLPPGARGAGRPLPLPCPADGPSSCLEEAPPPCAAGADGDRVNLRAPPRPGKTITSGAAEFVSAAVLLTLFFANPHSTTGSPSPVPLPASPPPPCPADSLGAEPVAPPSAPPAAGAAAADSCTKTYSRTARLLSNRLTPTSPVFLVKPCLR